MMLNKDFFSHDACHVAKSLLGKVIRRKYKDNWLSARIIETEAYYLSDKASHSSLGFTEKRKAMFMPPGTIYMYYARGQDSLNVSCGSTGDAVLIKSAFPYCDEQSPEHTLSVMQQLNPAKNGELRNKTKLCSGQTLLCKSLNIKVSDWDQQQFDLNHFYIEDCGDYLDTRCIKTQRLGISPERDADKLYRFISYDYAKYCTSNPLAKKNYRDGREYIILS